MMMMMMVMMMLLKAVMMKYRQQSTAASCSIYNTILTYVLFSVLCLNNQFVHI